MFSSIIYIWYEDGELRPSLEVVFCARTRPCAVLPSEACAPQRRAPTAGARARRQPPKRDRERSRTLKRTEGGDTRQWRRKPRAGRRRPARSGKPTSPVKRGRLSPPFHF